MSRIRFEWNIESRKIDRSDGEDQKAKRRRRRNLLRLLLLVGLFLAAMSLGALVIRQRLIDVRNQVAQLLQDTVKAEVAALRIGDRHTFLKIQGGVDDTWVQRQSILFQQYSDMKAAGQIELTGSILDVFIEDERARVLVQENINGRPYGRLWFYRRSGQGWQHVPPDYAFWGEKRQYDADGVQVSYRDVDKKLAEQLADAVAGWIGQGCGLLDCGSLPNLAVDIVTDGSEAVVWSNERTMHLVVRSPHLDIARADLPFDGNLRLRVGQLLAERMVNAHTDYRVVAYPHDSYFLRGAAVAWLAEYMTRIESDSKLIRSLADNFGADKVPLLLSQLSATSDMSSIRRVDSATIELANLDWSDFVEWRLRTETELVAAGAQDQWLSLYDTADDSVRLLAYERYNSKEFGTSFRVIDQVVWRDVAGSLQLRVTVEVETDGQRQEQIVVFNLVNDVWKRAN